MPGIIKRERIQRKRNSLPGKLNLANTKAEILAIANTPKAELVVTIALFNIYLLILLQASV
jgi:hypothetical protein